MTNCWRKWIVLSTWDLKWQQMEDVKVMWYIGLMRGIKHRELCKVAEQ